MNTNEKGNVNNTIEDAKRDLAQYYLISMGSNELQETMTEMVNNLRDFNKNNADKHVITINGDESVAGQAFIVSALSGVPSDNDENASITQADVCINGGYSELVRGLANAVVSIVQDCEEEKSKTLSVEQYAVGIFCSALETLLHIASFIGNDMLWSIVDVPTDDSERAQATITAKMMQMFATSELFDVKNGINVEVNPIRDTTLSLLGDLDVISVDSLMNMREKHQENDHEKALEDEFKNIFMSQE